MIVLLVVLLLASLTANAIQWLLHADETQRQAWLREVNSCCDTAVDCTPDTIICGSHDNSDERFCYMTLDVREVQYVS